MKHEAFSDRHSPAAPARRDESAVPPEARADVLDGDCFYRLRG